jgi:hypothetical protein
MSSIYITFWKEWEIKDFGPAFTSEEGAEAWCRAHKKSTDGEWLWRAVELNTGG